MTDSKYNCNKIYLGIDLQNSWKGSHFLKHNKTKSLLHKNIFIHLLNNVMNYCEYGTANVCGWLHLRRNDYGTLILCCHSFCMTSWQCGKYVVEISFFLLLYIFIIASKLIAELSWSLVLALYLSISLYFLRDPPNF